MLPTRRVTYLKLAARVKRKVEVCIFAKRFALRESLILLGFFKKATSPPLNL